MATAMTTPQGATPGGVDILPTVDLGLFASLPLADFIGATAGDSTLAGVLRRFLSDLSETDPLKIAYAKFGSSL